MEIAAHLEHPSNNIAELSLIGTGGGYGESSVIHIGNGKWIVVDSCYNPSTGAILPLEYLQTINADLNKVLLVICTHWDDDHIRGLSKIFELCPNASFVMARANDKAKFLQFVSLDYLKLKKAPSNSSSVEFMNCLRILESRNDGPMEAVLDKILLREIFSDQTTAEVISLSPSDYTVQEFDREVSTLITEYGSQERRVVFRSPNSRSVVLFLKLSHHRAILGVDLEISSNPREGWAHILNKSQSIDKKSSMFKIPHHGSENGYLERIWLDLLEPNPISKLTPWNKAAKLPNPEMLARYCSHTEFVYMTTSVLSDKPKRRDRVTEKMIRRFNDTLRESQYTKGIIRSRINMLDPTEKWKVDLIENAIWVNKAS